MAFCFCPLRPRLFRRRKSKRWKPSAPSACASSATGGRPAAGISSLRLSARSHRRHSGVRGAGLRCRCCDDWRAQPKHATHDQACEPSHEVFERVSANESASGQDLPIECFQELGGDVYGEYRVDRPGARVARWKQDCDEEQDHGGITLQYSVRKYVAHSSPFGAAPVDHRGRADEQHRHKQSEAGAHTDAIDHLSCNERHERDRHRQAIPEEPLVVRRQMVVARPERSQRHANKENRIGPALTRGLESRARVERHDSGQSPRQSGMRGWKPRPGNWGFRGACADRRSRGTRGVAPSAAATTPQRGRGG